MLWGGGGVVAAVALLLVVVSAELQGIASASTMIFIAAQQRSGARPPPRGRARGTQVVARRAASAARCVASFWSFRPWRTRNRTVEQGIGTIILHVFRIVYE